MYWSTNKLKQGQVTEFSLDKVWTIIAGLLVLYWLYLLVRGRNAALDTHRLWGREELLPGARLVSVVSQYPRHIAVLVYECYNNNSLAFPFMAKSSQAAQLTLPL